MTRFDRWLRYNGDEGTNSDCVAIWLGRSALLPRRATDGLSLPVDRRQL